MVSGTTYTQQAGNMYVFDSHMCISLTLVHKYKGNDIWIVVKSNNISNNIFSTMSHIPKRFISKATIAGDYYSSKKAKVVKKYLEEKGLKEWAAKTKGVDDKGAESAKVVLVMDLDFIASVFRSHTFSADALLTLVVPFAPSLGTLMST